MSIQRFDIEWLGDEFGMHKDYRESGDYTDAEVTERLFEVLDELIDSIKTSKELGMTSIGACDRHYIEKAEAALAAARGES